MEFTIRLATLEDTPALAGLLRSLEFFARIQAQTPEETLDHVQRELNQSLANPSHSLWVALAETGELAGFCSVHWLPYLILRGPEGYVSELFLSETYRGAGLGDRLLAEALAEAKARGCSRLMLLNSRERESYQRQFYAKHGWTERADMANFIYDLTEK